MQGIKPLTFIVFACFAVVQSNTNDIRVLQFSKKLSTRSSQVLLNSYHVRTSFVCAEKCVPDPCCNAYNLGPRDAVTQLMQCELLKRSRTPVVGDVSADGWELYVREGE